MMKFSIGLLKNVMPILLSFAMLLSGLLPTFGTSGIFGVSETTVEASSAPSVNIGDYIQLGNYNNAPILWRVIHKDPTTGEPVLLADRILSLKAFDAKGSYHTSGRQTAGSNYYPDSNIRQWLNSTSPNSGSNVIDWIQNDPNSANMIGGYNGYDAEKGFLSLDNFTILDRALLKPITHKVIIADSEKKDGGTWHHLYDESISNAMQNYDTTAYYKNVTDRVFLLSIKQLKEWVYDNSETLGVDYINAKPTAEAVAQSDYYHELILNTNSTWYYWLNTPYASSGTGTRTVEPTGEIKFQSAFDSTHGIRPAVQLGFSNAVTTTGDGSMSAPYQYDFKDTAPSDMKLSRTVFGDDTPPGTQIATISSSGEPMLDDTATYTFVSGTGDSDNSKFVLDGNKLLIGSSFLDASEKNTANIRIRVTDSQNNTYEKAFVLTVNDVKRYVRTTNLTRQIDLAATAIDPSLTISTTEPAINASTSINGASVLIGTNFVTGKDSLSYTGTLPSGVSATGYNSTTGLLRFNGSTTATNWQALMRTVKFTTTSTNNKPRKIYFSLGTALPLEHQHGVIHYYEHVSASVNWNNARSGAEARKAANIVNGYLATNNTQAEFDFLTRHYPSTNGYIGASDDVNVVNSSLGKNTTTGFANQWAVEGKYHWVTGPIEERVWFSEGNSPSAKAVEGQFAKWRSGEPNNSNGTEHYAEMYSDGFNDGAGTGNSNYFTEYYNGTDSVTAVVTVTDGAPTDIQMSQSIIAKDLLNGSTIARLTTSDPLIGDEQTYALVSGEGSDDNAAFSIVGNQLRLKQSFSSSTATSQKIRMRTTDGNGNSYEKAFVLTVSSATAYINGSQSSVTSTVASQAIDSALTVQNGATINGATVLINNNFESGKDTLSYTGALPTGVTASAYDTSKGLLRFSGTASAADWQTLLRTIKFSTTSTTNKTRGIAITLGTALPLMQANGSTNYYEIVNQSMSWSVAKTAAEARKAAGVIDGYLATVDTEAQQQFLVTYFSGNSWMGGSDEFSTINTALGLTTVSGFADQAAAEGKYFWVTGPVHERTQFSQGNSPNVTTVAGQYQKWNSGEPNNASNNEHYPSWSTSVWNDVSNTNNQSNYLVEYSGEQMKLTTQYEILPTLAVTFQPNGGSDVAMQAIIYNQPAMAPTAPTRNGYQFRGWFSDAGLTTSYDFSAPVTTPITIYAKWNNIPSDISVSNIKVGDYVQFGKYNDAPILWRVIQMEAGGHPVLFSDRILTIKAFDSNGSYHTGNTFRVNGGSNYYPDSNIRQWLNSSSPNSGSNLIDWIQNDPNATNVSYNPYNTEKGFLADGNFSLAERNMIKPYTHRTVIVPADAAKKDGGSEELINDVYLSNGVQNYDQAYYKNVTDHIFLLSIKQQKEWVDNRQPTLGWDFLQAKPTPQAVAQNKFTGYVFGVAISSDVVWPYYLNTSGKFQNSDFWGDTRVRTITGTSYVSSLWASDGQYGIRPAVQLNAASAQVTSGVGTKDNPLVFGAGSTTSKPLEITENEPAGKELGALTTVDGDAGDTATYSLVSGSGDTDNSGFEIVGTTLKTLVSFDYEKKTSLSIRVRVTDSVGASFEKVLMIVVKDLLDNSAPEDIIIRSPQAKSSLEIGEYVRFGTYENTPILWRVIHKESNGNPILFADRILAVKAFDAGGSYHTYSVRQSYGSNYYKDSNLRQWLNSSSTNNGSDLIDWKQNDPNAQNTFGLMNGQSYHTEKGFLADGNFNQIHRSLIRPYKHKVVLSSKDSAFKDGGTWSLGYNSNLENVVQNYDTGEYPAYHQFVTDDMFLLSVKQLKEWVYDNNALLGDYHLAKRTPQLESWFTDNSIGYNGYQTGDNYDYWLNSAIGDYGTRVVVGSDSTISYGYSYYGFYGVRPAFQLNVSYAVFESGSGSAQDPYVIDSDEVVGTTIEMDEEQPIGTIVGKLKTMDVDANDTATVTLVSGAGDTDNAKFAIDGVSLKTASVLDYETKTSYSLRVRVTDSADAIYEKVFTVNVNDVTEAPINEAPSNISLSATSIVENAGANAVIGSLSATDADAGDTATFSLVSGEGSTDNASFSIDGAALKAAASFDYEAKSSYSVRLRVTDAAGATFEKIFVISVTNIEDAAPSVPSGLTATRVTPTSISINWTASTDDTAVKGYNLYRNGAYVASVSGTATQYTFSGLLAGTSYSLTALAFDATNKRSARSTALSISTPSANSAPTNILLSAATIAENSGTNAVIGTLTMTDLDIGDKATFALVAGDGATDNGKFNISGSTLRASSSLDYEAKATLGIRVRVTDGGGLTYEKQFTISVTNVEDAAPSTPTGLNATKVTGTSVSVSWSASSDDMAVTGYNVYRNGVYVATVGGTTTRYTFSGLSSITSYAFSVLAFDAAKKRSAQSASITVTTLDGTKPSAPTNVASSNVTKTGARVTWTAATDNVGVTFYNIYRNGAYIATVSGTTRAYNLTGLTAGTTYSITVRAIDAAKNFTNSTALSVTTQP